MAPPTPWVRSNVPTYSLPMCNLRAGASLRGCTRQYVANAPAIPHVSGEVTKRWWQLGRMSMLSLRWNGPQRFHTLHVDAVLTPRTTVARDP